LYGPRIWVFDPFGLTKRVLYVNLAWGVEDFDPFILERKVYNHIAIRYWAY